MATYGIVDGSEDTVIFGLKLNKALKELSQQELKMLYDMGHELVCVEKETKKKKQESTKED
tara:strand:+ start:4381 stop:4563 length:183 start_codon:yes stop_codon:yes gene_type:complete